MSGPIDRLWSFLRELKRRSVYRVAVTYAIVAFGTLQAAELIFPATTLEGVYDVLVVIAFVGFPLAVVMAWAFEMTPEGVRRTIDEVVPGAERAPSESGSEGARSSGPSESGGHEGRFAIKLLVALGLLAGAGVVSWYLTGGGGGPGITDRSVAVLPFHTLGQDESSAITEGIQTGLQTRLSSISGLVVKSRTSAMRYRGSEDPLAEIAGELGVSWVLRGEVQESGDQIQVTVRLVNARRDEQVWANTYQRRHTVENVFDVQEEITRRIAEELETRLSPAERRQVAARPTADLEAYEFYVRGRSLLDQRTEPEMRQAARLFNSAIERDSAYALAWVGLADALTLLVDYGHAPGDTALPAARQAVRRALELNPESAEAHATLGLIHSESGEGARAVRQLRRAVELRPSYAEAHNWMSWLSLLLGWPEQALESARRAVSLNPLAPEPLANLGLSYLALGRLESALHHSRKARDFQPGYATGLLYEAASLYELERMDEVRSRLRDLRVAWAPSAAPTALALVDLADGDTASARAELERLEVDAESRFYPGLVYAALGDRERALEAFEQVEAWSKSPLLAWPTLSLRYLFSDVLSPMRGDPRYQELIRQVDLAWGLESDGSLPGDPDRSEARVSDRRPTLVGAASRPPEIRSRDAVRPLADPPRTGG